MNGGNPLHLSQDDETAFAPCPDFYQSFIMISVRGWTGSYTADERAALPPFSHPVR
jgi:hypothetical protein